MNHDQQLWWNWWVNLAVAVGGNGRARRTLRKKLQSLLKTYGLSPRGRGGRPQKGQSFWDFLRRYIAAALAFAGLGYELREFSAVLTSALYLLALALFFRGFWAWCDTRRNTMALYMAVGTAVLLFAWFDYNWLRDEWTPTFLYVVPTHELIDCERRAFFVDHSGPKHLENVKVIVKDNKSGAIEEVNDYKSGIEPGPQNPDSPRYFWVKPSHPWDEDYTITVTGSQFHSVQETVLRSSKQGVQFAVQITVGSKNKPVAS